MTEQTGKKYINVPVDEEEYERISKEAEEYGAAGRAPLLRLLAQRVRRFGDGDLVDGLARLRMAQKDGMYFNDSEMRAEDEEGANALETFKTDNE